MCPPGVDQTGRTPQTWALVVPTLEQKLALNSRKDNRNRSMDTVEELLFRCTSFNAFEKLARISHPQLEITAPRCAGHELSPLEKLPAELKAMILAQDSLSKRDVMSVGSCSTTLWTDALAFVRSPRGSRAPWAAQPLACIGRYLMDLPPAFHTIYPHVRVEHEKWAVQRYGRCPARRWQTTTVQDFTDVKDLDNARQWRDAFNAVHQSLDITTARKRNDLGRVLLGGLSDKLGNDWKLRNLTTKQEVRLHLNTELGSSPRPHVDGAPWLSLDKALLLRISWTDDLHYETFCPYPVATDRGQGRKFEGGLWAGHSFEIVRAAISKDDGFDDVTESIIKDARALRLDKRQ